MVALKEGEKMPDIKTEINLFAYNLLHAKQHNKKDVIIPTGSSLIFKWGKRTKWEPKITDNYKKKKSSLFIQL